MPGFFDNYCGTSATSVSAVVESRWAYSPYGNGTWDMTPCGMVLILDGIVCVGLALCFLRAINMFQKKPSKRLLLTTGGKALAGTKLLIMIVLAAVPLVLGTNAPSNAGTAHTVCDYDGMRCRF